MKTVIMTIGAVMAFYASTWAQRPDFYPQCKEAMQQLAYLEGDWEGKAVMMTQQGERELDQSEHIEWKLDGVALAIEGTGRANGEIAFQAFAILNFDPYTKQYKFRSYVKEGYSTDAYFRVIEDNKFEWGFDIPTGGKTRYTIKLDPKQKSWNEVGEYSRDGNTWYPFIKLNLTKL